MPKKRLSPKEVVRKAFENAERSVEIQDGNFYFAVGITSGIFSMMLLCFGNHASFGSVEAEYEALREPFLEKYRTRGGKS